MYFYIDFFSSSHRLAPVFLYLLAIVLDPGRNHTFLESAQTPRTISIALDIYSAVLLMTSCIIDFARAARCGRVAENARERNSLAFKRLRRGGGGGGIKRIKYVLRAGDFS